MDCPYQLNYAHGDYLNIILVPAIITFFMVVFESFMFGFNPSKFKTFGFYPCFHTWSNMSS